MFFNRFGPWTESPASVFPPMKAKQVTRSSPFPRLSSRGARRLAALSLAAALASPLAVRADDDAVPTVVPGRSVPLLAQDQPKASNEELLRRGVDQYRANQYEEAQATLQQVDKAGLSQYLDWIRNRVISTLRIRRL